MYRIMLLTALLSISVPLAADTYLGGTAGTSEPPIWMRAATVALTWPSWQARQNHWRLLV